MVDIVSPTASYERAAQATVIRRGLICQLSLLKYNTPMIAFRRSLQASVRLSTPLRSSVRCYAKDSKEETPAQFAGAPGGGAFDKRERASENYYVREHEREQLKKLRLEIEKREKDLAQLKDQAEKLEN